MLKISENLINIVKNYDPTKTKKICFTAPHFDTRGATLQTKDKHSFTCEEDLFKVVVREATDQLNKEGWKNVDQAGINEHEMSLSSAYYSSYDLVISNHFDTSAPAGKKATLYTNEGLANNINGIRNMITARSGISGAGISYRPELYMTSMKNCVLIEWFAANDEFDVNIQLSQVTGESKPKPPVNPSKPSGIWWQDAIGNKYGDETVLDAYEERGEFTYTNVPHALSIYPDYPQAMQDKDADSNVFMVNGDSFTYWAYIKTNKYSYLIYTRDNAKKGCVAIKNNTTAQSYGDAI